MFEKEKFLNDFNLLSAHKEQQQRDLEAVLCVQALFYPGFSNNYNQTEHFVLRIGKIYVYLTPNAIDNLVIGNIDGESARKVH